MTRAKAKFNECTWLSAILALLPLGCGDDGAPPEPVPDAKVEVIGLRSAYADADNVVKKKSRCIELWPPGQEQFLVDVGVTDFEVRPPGACYGVARCGYVEAILFRKKKSVLSRGRGASTELVGADSELTHLTVSTEGLAPGEYDLVVSLRASDGSAYQTESGISPTCKRCELTVELAESCE